MEEIIPRDRRYSRGTRVAILNDPYVGRVVAGPCVVIGTRDTLYVKNIYDLESVNEPDIEYVVTHKNLVPWNDDYVVGSFLPGHSPILVREGLYRPGDNVTLNRHNSIKEVKISGGPYAAQYIVYEVDERTHDDMHNIYKKYKVYYDSFFSHSASLDRMIAKRRAKLEANRAHATRIPEMKSLWTNKIGSIDFRNAPEPPKSWYRKAVNTVSSQLNRGMETLSEKLYPFYLENENNAAAAPAAAAPAAAAAAAAAPAAFPTVRYLPNSAVSKIANFLVEPQTVARAKVRNITRNLPRQERIGIQLKGGGRSLTRRSLRSRR